MIPRGAKMIFNHAGTAAGIEAMIGGTAGKDVTEYRSDGVTECASVIANAPPHSDSPSARHDSSSTRVFVMPGVPKEMKLMFSRNALPVIRAAGGGAVILSRAIAELLGNLMKRDRNPSVGTTVSSGVVSLRVNSRFASADEAKQNLAATVEQCRAALGDLIFGEDEQSLQSVVGGMLKRRMPPVTVATAESCTGGLLAKMLTDIPGSSAYFQRGWVTYSNEAKQDLLGVPSEVLAKHGAVSEPTVLAMAGSARSLAKADYALAISGIAGPDGGTVEKPVGTTWIAISNEAGAAARHFIFPGDREFVRERAAKMALTMLRFELLGKPVPF
jgi:nicotinamide-nucleotide amidase